MKATANTLAIMAWWTATFRGEITEIEIGVWEKSLANTDLADAKAVIDGIAALGGYPPTPQRIAELAEDTRRARVRSNVYELPLGGGDRTIGPDLPAWGPADDELHHETAGITPWTSAPVHPPLGMPGGAGPYMTFAYWQEHVATDEEREKVAQFGLGEVLA